ncbi:MAG: RagB/SusD family nutrient uptake outer membrane protein [Bacteroidales bacterium]|nr:RagB/SusD family nutrient uptake outer membrane protein [Candidatus Hennigimonas equi]
MKKAIFAFIAILSALTVTVVSCKKDPLEEVVYSTLTSDLAFTSVENAEAAVVAMYAPMRQLYFRYMNDVNDVTTDLSNGKIAEFDRLNDEKIFVHDYNKILYSEFCKIATRANIVIDELPKMDDALFEETDSKEVMMAQAYFMRAYAYYNLSDIYYQVPLILSSEVNTAGEQTCASIDDIDAAIESDLKEAVKNLPKSWDVANSQKATYGAAEALLTEFYMRQAGRYRNAGKDATTIWQKALAECNKILAMVGSEYELLPDVRDAFSPSTAPGPWSQAGLENKEIIWAQKNNGSAQDGTSNLGLMFSQWEYNLGWACINSSLELAWLFDKEDLRYKNLLVTEFANIYGIFSTPGFYKAPDSIEEVGGIANLIKGRTTPYVDVLGQGNDVPVEAWATINCSELTCLGTNKYPNTDMWNYSYINPNNFPIFRVAEFYLAKAEILNEISGPTKEAVDAINVIRTRAFGNTEHNYTLAGVGSKENFRSLICDERAFELNNEAKRRPDLIRMGFWKDRLDKFIESKKTMAHWQSINNPKISEEDALGTYKTYPKDLTEKDIRRYWPIPFREVEISPELANARTF